MNADNRPDAPQGLLASASRLGVNALALAENKVALFANEWEAERVWQFRIGLRMILATLAMTLASLFVGAWLTLLLWDWSHSLAVLIPGVMFGVIAAVVWRSSQTMSGAKPPAFAMTREELRKDRAALDAFSGVEHD